MGHDLSCNFFAVWTGANELGRQRIKFTALYFTYPLENTLIWLINVFIKQKDTSILIATTNAALAIVTRICDNDDDVDLYGSKTIP